MKLFEVQIKLTSPFKTSWQGDILFGHLAWAYRERFGEEKLVKWLEDFKSEPSFILSDGFITNSFPRPMIPPPARKFGTKKEKIENIKHGKKLKKQLLLHTEDFLGFLKGEPLTFSHTVTGSFKSAVQTHNTIGRDTGKSLSSDGLFEDESTYLVDAETISFFVRSSETNFKEFLQLLKHVSLSGYGKKKSLGFGQFQIKHYIERADLDNASQEANGVIWLSYGVPKKEDPTDGWYKLQTKYGKLGAHISDKGTIFKKPFTRLMPGSVFRTNSPKPYYGHMISGISPNNPTIVQYAYALALPVKLPNYL